MDGFFERVIAGDVTGGDLALVFGALLLGWIGGALADALNRLAARKAPEHSVRRAVFSAFDGPLRWAIVVAAGMVSVDYVTEAADFRAWQGHMFLVLAMPFALWFALRLNDSLTELWSHRADQTDTSFDDQLVPVVRTGVRVTLWVLAALLVIQNLGGEVGSLLAGFGLGGLAVAMASKDTIANLFGSVVIFVDRPFVVGDWVQIGEHEGVVEEVGLRVTRIRTFAKSLITVPNAELTTSAINNWSRMPKRRIKMTVGVTYDTKAAQMEAAVQALREVVRDMDDIETETAMVYFNGFGASSLDIFVYCFAMTRDWGEYLDIQQRLMLRFMRSLENLGLELAFPTRTVHLVGAETPPLPGA